MDIKVRAWDKEEKVMFNVGAIAWSHNAFDTYSYAYGTQPHCYENKCGSILHLNEECVFMQYTGLVDENYVEIYEGNIVEFYGHKFKVVFEIGSFMLAKIDNDTNMNELFSNCWNDDVYPLSQLHWDYGDENVLHDVKVIGNIYENPEFLGDDVNV